MVVNFESLLLLILVFFVMKTNCAIDEDSPPLTLQNKVNPTSDSNVDELNNYVESIVILLLGKNLGDNEIMENKDYEEHLKRFVKQIETIFLLGIFNTTDLAKEYTQRKLVEIDDRVTHLSAHIVSRLTETLYLASMKKFNEKLSYKYDAEHNSFVFNKTIKTVSTDGLCGRKEDSCNYTSNAVSLVCTGPSFRNDDKQSASLNETENSEMHNGTKLVKYHIIPPALIRQFLSLWLRNNSTENLENNIVTRITDRLQRSVLKIIWYYIKNIESDNNQTIEINENFFDSVESLLTNLKSGMNFLGPRNRGPLYPAYENSSDFEDFEVDCVIIIGSYRYQRVRQLFDHLVEYVKNAHTYSEFNRTTQGVQLFIKIITTIVSNSMTPFNESLWEFRVLSQKELERVPEKSRREFRTQKFWAIKESNETSSKNFMAQQKCFSVEDYSSNQLSKFISDLIKSLVASQAAGDEPTALSQYLNRLYYFYYFQFLRNEFENSGCLKQTFDSFLYSEISKSYAWRSCIGLEELNEPHHWCQAWRRIMLNPGIGNSWKNISNKPKHHYKNTKTILYWLSEKIRTENNPLNLVVTKNEQPIKICYKSNNTISFS